MASKKQSLREGGRIRRGQRTQASDRAGAGRLPANPQRALALRARRRLTFFFRGAAALAFVFSQSGASAAPSKTGQREALQSVKNEPEALKKNLGGGATSGKPDAKQQGGARPSHGKPGAKTSGRPSHGKPDAKTSGGPAAQHGGESEPAGKKSPSGSRGAGPTQKPAASSKALSGRSPSSVSKAPSQQKPAAGGKAASSNLPKQGFGPVESNDPAKRAEGAEKSPEGMAPSEKPGAETSPSKAGQAPGPLTGPLTGTAPAEPKETVLPDLGPGAPLEKAAEKPVKEPAQEPSETSEELNASLLQLKSYMEPFLYDPSIRRRDPFFDPTAAEEETEEEKQVIIKPEGKKIVKDKIVRTPPELYALKSIELKGIIWDIKSPRALFKLPKAEGFYTLFEGDRIGRHGVIEDIAEDRVQIKETIVKGDGVDQQTETKSTIKKLNRLFK